MAGLYQLQSSEGRSPWFTPEYRLGSPFGDVGTGDLMTWLTCQSNGYTVIQ